VRGAAAALAAAWAALAMAGCASHAKDMAAAAQPAALSVPQTSVYLPPEQPVDPAALPDDTAEEKPAPATPEMQPAKSDAPEPAPAPTTAHRPAPAPRAPATPNPAQTHVEAPAEQPETPVETPPERPAIQAIVPAEQQRQLRDSADARKREVHAILARMAARKLSASEQDLERRIQFFVSRSDEAEKSGDMSQADAFAQRAQDLARGWQGGH